MERVSALERGVVIVRRKVGERVVIGEGDDRIVIEVIRPKGANLGMAIDAPRSVTVRRAETLEGADAVA